LIHRRARGKSRGKVKKIVAETGRSRREEYTSLRLTLRIPQMRCLQCGNVRGGKTQEGKGGKRRRGAISAIMEERGSLIHEG